MIFLAFFSLIVVKAEEDPSEGFLFFVIGCLVLSYLPLLLLVVSPRFSICLAPAKRGKMKILFSCLFARETLNLLSLSFSSILLSVFVFLSPVLVPKRNLKCVSYCMHLLVRTWK